MEFSKDGLIKWKQQWRIQDFPDGGSTNSEDGSVKLLFWPFSQKLHEYEINLDWGRAFLAPPWILQTTRKHYPLIFVIIHLNGKLLWRENTPVSN